MCVEGRGVLLISNDDKEKPVDRVGGVEPSRG